MHETYLNIDGDEQLLDACRRCFASLFTDRAIHYRIDQGFDHFKVALSIGVMKMVRSDLAASGVIFTLDTESGFRDVVFVTGAYGLGENVVQGAVDPDEFYVFKPTFEAGHRAVLRRLWAARRSRWSTPQAAGARPRATCPRRSAERERFCISDEDVLTLADYAIKVEEHYSAKSRQAAADGHRMGQGRRSTASSIWCRRGPETVASQRRGQRPGDLRAARRRASFW